MNIKRWDKLKRILTERRDFYNFITPGSDDTAFSQVFKVIHDLEEENKDWANGKTVEEIRAYYDALRVIEKIGR